MRLILSRKGFDSSAGGCPSPIFPDGSLYALPIPDPKSKIHYRDIHHGEHDIGALVEDLTRGRITAEMGAHLDPDMQTAALPRLPGWQPLLGQTGAAQGHLRKQGVGVGDLFLFFGLFRPVEKFDGHWRFVKDEPARHVLWGWLSIGEVIKVDALESGALPWARYHPHFAIGPDAANTLYIAASRLVLNGEDSQATGAGTFHQREAQLTLTAPAATKPSLWRLPKFFYPEPERPPLSYHGNRSRWRLSNTSLSSYCLLQCAHRGQEFVLDLDNYPEAFPWLKSLIEN